MFSVIDNLKVSEAIKFSPVDLTKTFITPEFSNNGIPLSVCVAELKVSQLGKELPSDKLILSIEVSLGKLLLGILNLNNSLILAC